MIDFKDCSIRGKDDISAQDFADGIPALEHRNDNHTGSDNSNQDFAESMPVLEVESDLHACIVPESEVDFSTFVEEDRLKYDPGSYSSSDFPVGTFLG